MDRYPPSLFCTTLRVKTKADRYPPKKKEKKRAMICYIHT